MSRIAVLTGDLISSESRSLHDIGKAMDALADVSQNIARQHGAGDWRFSQSSGDGWQAAFSNPAVGPRAMLMYRAALRSLSPQIDTRISLARGDFNAVFPEDLNTALGDPFTRSGRLLAAMHADTGFTASNDARLDALLRLMDHISKGWTQAQAAAVDAALRTPGAPKHVLAAQLNKSRQAVDQALKAAGYPPLETALALWEGPLDV